MDFTMAVEAVRFLKNSKTNDHIQAEQIAQALDFSVGYLQKTMQALAKHGIVECKRGRIGGARLRKKNVTLLDLWNITCGPIDADNPPIPELKKPLKAFSDALKKIKI